MTNEKTSKRVSAIAGRILKRLNAFPCSFVYIYESEKGPEHIVCSVRELKAIAASCLTQTPDKPRGRKKK